MDISIEARFADAIIERSIPPTSMGSIIDNVNRPISGICLAIDANESTDRNAGFIMLKNTMQITVRIMSIPLSWFSFARILEFPFLILPHPLFALLS